MPLERLQKVIASAGVASRRASEALIAAGRVTVDGAPARVGDQVDPLTARIEIDGHPIGGPAAAVHVALNKPAGVTSTVQDRHADRTVLQLLPTAMVAETRLYPVGRLDRDSEGLLLLTNDGDWAERVLHPRFGIEREYAVGLPAWLANEQRAALDAGVDLEEGRAAFAHPIRPASGAETSRLLASLTPPPAEGLAWYRVVLRQGWKRQVRRMFAAVGAPISRLVRVRIGPVRLDDLQSGRYRRLRGTEIKALGAGRVEAAKPAPKPAAAPSQSGRSAGGRTVAGRAAATGTARDPRRAGPAGSSDRPVRPGRPRPAAASTPSETAGPAEQLPRPRGPERPARPGRKERPDRPRGMEGPDRPDWPDRPDRPDRPAGPRRPGRPR
jgi:23S rRNA pseudouridine2605 synthase